MTVEQVYAVVAAAGSGTRLGEARPQAVVVVGGRSMLERCLAGLAASQGIDLAVVTVSEDMRTHAGELVRTHAGAWLPMQVSVVTGGTERTDSVLAGLEAVESMVVGTFGEDGPSGVLVAVHDAARCLTPPATVSAVVSAAEQGLENNAWAGVVPVLPVTDTVKVVSVADGGPADGAEIIRSTPVREGLRAAQTPQVFALDGLLAANRMQQAREELDSAHPTGQPPTVPAPTTVTDDASLMEMAGETVVVVPGSAMSFKITVPEDLERAERLVAGDAP